MFLVLIKYLSSLVATDFPLMFSPQFGDFDNKKKIIDFWSLKSENWGVNINGDFSRH